MEYPTFKEVKESYLKGDIKLQEGSYVIYQNEGAHPVYCNGLDFKAFIEFDKQYQEDLTKAMWGDAKL
jgi:pantothenate kinase